MVLSVKVILAVITTLPALMPVTMAVDAPDDVTIANEVLLEVHATDRIALLDVTERFNVPPSYNLSVVLLIFEVSEYVTTA